MLAAEIGIGLREFELEVAFELGAGGRLALVGPSGAGKSTICQALAGLVRPSRGRIARGDEVWFDAASGTNLLPERRRCGYLFQDYALFEHMSVWRNVAYGLGPGPRSRSARHEAAIELLDRFGVAGFADASPAELSGGERQRVALARALGSRPELLLLDEPLSALDAATRAGAMRELDLAISDAKAPALIVTHDFSEAAMLADEIAVIERGKVVQRGPAEHLAAQPASEFVAAATGSVVLTGTARVGSGGSTEIDLGGGAAVVSTGEAKPGPVSVSVHPWEIALESAGSQLHGSQRNRLDCKVSSIARIGGRIRVGLDGSQPLVAEITPEAADDLQLAPGVRVVATWKAAATRVVGERARLESSVAAAVV